MYCLLMPLTLCIIRCGFALMNLSSMRNPSCDRSNSEPMSKWVKARESSERIYCTERDGSGEVVGFFDIERPRVGGIRNKMSSDEAFVGCEKWAGWEGQEESENGDWQNDVSGIRLGKMDWVQLR
ncbi:hypothetical protein BDD12DRAFT_381331 [Trichophaea hybrida]|nr:hypothetical protein BDD12DRAFT_381331 [Trichophaea hybrida]